MFGIKNKICFDTLPTSGPEALFAKYMPKPQVEYPNVGEKNETYLKKVYMQTWGCQMNVADSERMLGLLGTLNYRPTENLNDADFILLNTCHIREKARHKVVSRLGEIRPLKEANPNIIIAVAGCVAQAESQALAKEVPYIDMIFGPDQIEELPTLIEKVIEKNEQERKTEETFTTHKTVPFILTKFDNKEQGYSIPIDVIPPYYDENKSEVTRYVNIIKGCNNFCTFCVVPYTRGREKSRAENEILDEVNFLVNKGVKEIILLGQNVNSYGLDLIGATDVHSSNGKLPFADLLHTVSNVLGVERIRFTTSNPHDFTPTLADAFAKLPKVTNSFHLAVQSGSDRILDRMNRQYTRAEYFERVKWIRDVRPEIAFSTDIIVGFPGETEQDFEDTMSLVQEMQYAFIYAFKYSIRKGTPATRFKDQVPEEIKDRRLQMLLDLQKKETERQNLAEIAKVRNVLILYKNRKEENTWYGRSYEGRLVKVHSPRNIMGLILPVKITDANLIALEGHLA
ncbi:tRNA (N6-isopentenyl adenosine(37)-C2)-methylthiotransferase MiaB [Fluviispira multicolorata]|uniref:tRNA-2-methylthio-N(6)-dimethylallyladenosine synthase n=1 Tax=Fluviispira multicolorata TaxID=2654512 RepID=A0A833N3U9_9BACT|nr:tRNA (N6-isopentenyl adenosine(37)-C2)-methylthiotransferase MiaB [Fluviispira multicolorata]KAB8029197.1 tRNA (N6-isopentenyl adenosine(37)-C2)-methylthiotransferase MiaB [Fluviispira multicolorata]